jgi:hypothetical protein
LLTASRLEDRQVPLALSGATGGLPASGEAARLLKWWSPFTGGQAASGTRLNTPMNTTAYFIIALILLVALYDTVAAIVGGYEATITRDLRVVAMSHPIVAFLAGLICGHLFWSK